VKLLFVDPNKNKTTSSNVREADKKSKFRNISFVSLYDHELAKKAYEIMAGDG
jgi:hypothetical protein